MQSQFLKLLLLVSVLAALGGCGKDSNSGSGSGSSSSPSESGAAGRPIVLTLLSKWSLQEDASYAVEGTCEVPATASRGSLTTCEISVDEGRLYYSNLRFTIATEATGPLACSVLSFVPYYYVRSTSATYRAPSDPLTDVNCSGAATVPGLLCYGGAGPVMFSDTFLKFRGKFIETVTQPTVNFDIKAEFQVQSYGAAVNYLVTNDLANRTASIASGPKSYVANSMVDYTIDCMDYWGYPVHTLKLTIHDEDKDGSESDAEDNFPDWD